MSVMPVQVKIPLSVGLSLFWVPSERRDPCVTVTVVNISRKWATLSNGVKVDTQTGMPEQSKVGYKYPGVYLVDEGAWNEHKTKLGIWRAIQQRMVGMPDLQLSIEQLTDAAKLLGVKIHT